MKHNKKIIVAFLIFLFLSFSGLEAKDSLETILASLKNRYKKANFSVYFTQVSKLKALDMEDSAEGYAFFKYPSSVRWEYYTPEKQIIASDGKKIWIFKQEENQLLVGNASNYFKGGKGISFLSNVDDLIDNFFIELLEAKSKKYVLKLVPMKRQAGIAEMYVEIAKKTFFITKIVNYNAYGDETKIMMGDFNFNANLANTLFELKAKNGSDVIELN